MGEMEPRDPAQMRVSDQDRHAVAETLRKAAGDGRLDLDELDERLELALRAKTYADLQPLTADLPAHGAASAHLARRLERPMATPGSGLVRSSAVMGDVKRRGAWVVGAEHRAVAVMGDVLLDLRQALFETDELHIHATSFMGTVKVLVDAQTRVELDGTAIMGDFTQVRDKTTAELGPTSRLVRITGTAVMGDVKVERQPPPGTPRKLFGTY